ncbi:DUF6460 domain-containing protein [Agrobacterium sp. ES01]|uniref:DUF6460 domain-containing protein n=1 Tax=Agrobacterium sp. ES01 TaxID=3420714 RepID=UPI003D13EA93
MRHMIIALFKIALASLFAGIGLSFFGITWESVIGLVGLTPQRLVELAGQWMTWCAPKIMLGALFVVPIWFITYILLPPRG